MPTIFHADFRIPLSPEQTATLDEHGLVVPCDGSCTGAPPDNEGLIEPVVWHLTAVPDEEGHPVPDSDAISFNRLLEYLRTGSL